MVCNLVLYLMPCMADLPANNTHQSRPATMSNSTKLIEQTVGEPDTPLCWHFQHKLCHFGPKWKRHERDESITQKSSPHLVAAMSPPKLASLDFISSLPCLRLKRKDRTSSEEASRHVEAASVSTLQGGTGTEHLDQRYRSSPRER